ncbi:hypothetical protein RUND412_005005 [Rhizina undulata]
MESAGDVLDVPTSPVTEVEGTNSSWEDELIEHSEAEGCTPPPPPPPPPTRSNTWADAVRSFPASLAKVPWNVITTRLQDVYKPRRKSQSPLEPLDSPQKPESEPEMEPPASLSCVVITPETVTLEAEATLEFDPADIPLPEETDSEYGKDGDDEEWEPAGVSVVAEVEESNGVPIPVGQDTMVEDPQNEETSLSMATAVIVEPHDPKEVQDPDTQQESTDRLEDDDGMSEYNDEHGGVQLESPEPVVQTSSESQPLPITTTTTTTTATIQNIDESAETSWIELSLSEAFPDEVFPELCDEPSSDTDSAIETDPYWRDIKNIQKWRWVTSRQALFSEYERLLLAKRGEEPAELIRIGRGQQREEIVDEEGYVLEKLVVYRREEWAVRVKGGKMKLPRNESDWMLVTVTVDFETAYGWEGSEPESWRASQGAAAGDDAGVEGVALEC